MKIFKQTSVYLICCLEAGAFGCGRNLASESGAAGAPAETGGSGGTGGGSACPGFEIKHFAACWDRELGPSSGERVVNDLSYVGAVEPDEAYCVQGFPHRVGKVNFTYATAPFVAWEFEDAAGDSLVIQFAVEGATQDLVSAGDVVDFRAPGFFDIHGFPHAGALLERAGAPIVGFHLDLSPASGEAYGLTIETAEAMCPEDEGTFCGVPRAIRVAAGDESKVIPVDASATVGGLTIFNAYYSDNRDCEETPPGWPIDRPDSEIGFYRARESSE